ncbi:MAG: response regulator [Deltaproteobacteria bacterium]|nr:response regulator [Deltaproteobacteria bacterium]
MPEEKKTVLVIDDEPDTVVYISSLLEDNGYATVSAKDGSEALDKIKEGLPDLITLDITMPEKSGVRFYRDMKENDAWKDIPIIIITGISKDFEKFISTRSQVPPPKGYLSKPIDQEELLKLADKLTTSK